MLLSFVLFTHDTHDNWTINDTPSYLDQASSTGITKPPKALSVTGPKDVVSSTRTPLPKNAS